MSERVRIHLRLPQAEKAEICLRLNRYSSDGLLISSAHVANATALTLTNVQPILEEAKRAKVAAGLTGKTPHAYLEGDLVSWAGYFNNNARASHRLALTAYQTKEGISPADLKKITEEGYRLGYNPKRYRVFYGTETTPHTDSKFALTQKFCAANKLVALHWAFFADGKAKLAPLKPEDQISNSAAPTAGELTDIPKGLATTQARLAAFRR